jgi:hypothetical protein
MFGAAVTQNASQIPKHLSERYAQTIGQHLDNTQTSFFVAQFKIAQVLLLDSDFLRKRNLAHSFLFTEMPDTLSESFANVF